MLTTRYQILTRAASGDSEAIDAAVHVLLKGLRAYFQSNGNISIERCLGLPSSWRAYHLARRDFWLCEAHESIDAITQWRKSVALSEEIKLFSNILWPRWRELNAAPAGSSLLRTSLFNAFKAASCIPCAKGLIPVPDTARQVHNIVKRIS